MNEVAKITIFFQNFSDKSPPMSPSTAIAILHIIFANINNHCDNKYFIAIPKHQIWRIRLDFV